MRLAYYTLHFILICVLAPWLIGASYSIVSSNYDSLFVAGLGIVVFSFPVTFVLAMGCLIALRFFEFELNSIYSCISGLTVGVFMGILLGRVLDAENLFYMISSGAVGLLIGYVEYVLSKCIHKTE
jgi:NhaP-type Na+/H+ or K+/H+ antiporter